MVSFVCDTCNDTLKKPKLDQHAQRCWAVYTCLDCNTTFEGTSYRAHTSCISEDQKYQKSVYKAPKKPNKNHPGAPFIPAATTSATAAPSTAVPETPSAASITPIETPSVAKSSTTTNGTKRPREDNKDEADKLKKQRKAEKKAAKKASKAAATAPGMTSTTPAAAKAEEASAPATASKEVSTKDGGAEIKSFLAKVVPDVLKESRTLGEVKRMVVEKAAAQGLNKEADVVEAFEKGVFLGGDKPKRMLKLSFE